MIRKLDSFLTKIDLETVDLDWQFCHTVKNQLIGGNSTMKTKKLTPRNSAPVQREINTTSSEGGTGLYNVTPLMRGSRVIRTDPFAGDDAE